MKSERIIKSLLKLIGAICMMLFILECLISLDSRYFLEPYLGTKATIVLGTIPVDYVPIMLLLCVVELVGTTSLSYFIGTFIASLFKTYAKHKGTLTILGKDYSVDVSLCGDEIRFYYKWRSSISAVIALSFFTGFIGVSLYYIFSDPHRKPPLKVIELTRISSFRYTNSEVAIATKFGDKYLLKMPYAKSLAKEIVARAGWSVRTETTQMR